MCEANACLIVNAEGDMKPSISTPSEKSMPSEDLDIKYSTLEGDSSCEKIQIRPGIKMIIANNGQRQGSRTVREIKHAPISFGYNLLHRIRCIIRHRGKRELEFERSAGSSAVSYLPKSYCTIETPSEERILGLSLHFSLSSFGNLFSEVPQSFRKILSGRDISCANQRFYHQSRLNSESALVINQILNCPYHGETRRLFLEAKSLELVALKLAEIEQDRYLVEPADLSRQELECVREAHQILVDRIETPPGLMELSREVGINRNKLNNGFKRIYGDTVFNILRNIRLTRAYTLLLNTELSLSEIALSIGYNSQSSFTTAFSRKFGQSPKIVRQDRIGLCTNRKNVCLQRKTSFFTYPNIPDRQPEAMTGR